MALTKRQVLLHGGVIGAGIVASNLTGMAALAAGTPPTRRTLQGLAWNDPIVATYRDAVGMMKAMKPTEQYSWVKLASIHGSDPNTYHFCPHGNWYFLPWHRAYTVMYERIVRKLTKNDDFAMPFWDWTANPVMPEVFTMAKTPDGKPNPLYVSDAGWTRTWPAKKPMPAENVGPAVLTKILAPTEYEDFGTSRPEGQDSLDPSWITTGTGAQDELEGNAHNMVHNNIGGWMPSASSPRDPIFFMHHCNIDRLWAVWNLHNKNSTESLWTDMPFTDNFLDVEHGGFWSPKVKELFVPEDLGYTYGLRTVAVAAAAPPAQGVLELSNKLTTLFAMPGVASTGTAGITTVVAANTQTAKPGHPLAIPVTVPVEALKAIGSRPVPGSGMALMDFAASREQAAPGVHALGFIRDVVVTNPHSTMFRVFIDVDDLTEATPITDPHYVGTFGIFHNAAHAAHGGHTAAPSFAVNLTDVIQRVYGGDKSASGQIRVQILPVPATSGAAEIGTATPGRVEIAFVSV
jgi:tyrosinase